MDWSPENIIGLAGELAWPVVILIIAWRLKDALVTGISNFFLRNKFTEVSVGPSGISAKMEATKQVSESEKDRTQSGPLPEGMDYKSIKRTQTERSTKFTIELYENIKSHMEALDIDQDEKTDLAMTELSIYQASLIYIDITSVIFTSQFDLFDNFMYPNNSLSSEEIKPYYEAVIARNPDVFDDWDLEQYLAYPLSNGIITKEDGEYRLTNLGTSYVMNVRNNPMHKNYMTQL